MRARWRTLFGCALTALIGVSWFAQRFGFSWADWLGVDFVGVCAACVIGFLGAVSPTRKRWPAAVALVCATPMALSMLSVAPRLPRLIRLGGAPGVLMFGGVAATIVVAIYVLFSTPPPIQVERIPSARVT